MTLSGPPIGLIALKRSRPEANDLRRSNSSVRRTRSPPGRRSWFLAPKLAEEIAANIEPHTIVDTENVSFAGWPRPNVALPPWETCPRWYRWDQIEENEQKAA